MIPGAFVDGAETKGSQNASLQSPSIEAWEENHHESSLPRSRRRKERDAQPRTFTDRKSSGPLSSIGINERREPTLDTKLRDSIGSNVTRARHDSKCKRGIPAKRVMSDNHWVKPSNERGSSSPKIVSARPRVDHEQLTGNISEPDEIVELEERAKQSRRPKQGTNDVPLKPRRKRVSSSKQDVKEFVRGSYPATADVDHAATTPDKGTQITKKIPGKGNIASGRKILASAAEKIISEPKKVFTRESEPIYDDGPSSSIEAWLAQTEDPVFAADGSGEVETRSPRRSRRKSRKGDEDPRGSGESPHNPRSHQQDSARGVRPLPKPPAINTTIPISPLAGGLSKLRRSPARRSASSPVQQRMMSPEARASNRKSQNSVHFTEAVQTPVGSSDAFVDIYEPEKARDATNVQGIHDQCSNTTDNMIQRPNTTISYDEQAQDSYEISRDAAAADVRTPMTQGDDSGEADGRLTTHADLISVLSFPRAGRRSIRSARSIRSQRSRADSGSVQELLQKLATGETRYHLELQVLVDKIIPAILSSILSKSTSSAATSLLHQASDTLSGQDITKPVVDMGVALERLRSLHKRLRSDSLAAFLTWMQGAQRVYADYIKTWRLGFHGVSVSVCSAELQVDGSTSLTTDHNGIESHFGGEEEQLDLAYLLKRPLVRLKVLTKTIREANLLSPSQEATDLCLQYQALLEAARLRFNEETARLEDDAAANMDTSMCRDLRTLQPLSSPQVDKEYHVRARDGFILSLHHTSGDVIECEVELILRESETSDKPGGDVMISSSSGTERHLLFPPIPMLNLSCGQGATAPEIILRISGDEDAETCVEVLNLSATDENTARDWLEMLGVAPSQNLDAGPQVNNDDQYQEVQNLGDAQTAGNSFMTEDAVHVSDTHEAVSPVNMDIGKASKRNTYEIDETKDSKIYSPTTQQQSRKPSSSRKSRKVSGSSQRTISEGVLASPAHKSLSTRRKHSPRMASKLTAEAEQRSRSVQPEQTDDHQGGWKNLLPLRFFKIMSSPASGKADSIPDIRVETEEMTPESKHVEGIQSKSEPMLDMNHLRSALPLTGTEANSLISSSSETLSDSDGASLADTEASSVSDAAEESRDVAMPLITRDSRHMMTQYKEVSKSSPEGTLRPSDSASQAPYQGVPAPTEFKMPKMVASIFAWSDAGAWKSLHPDDCSIVVSPGLIQAFELSAAHSQEHQTHFERMALVKDEIEGAPGSEQTQYRPLVALELTPLVPLRKGTALDIAIRSPVTKDSLIKSGSNIMFRSRNPEECEKLYAMINWSRINNPTYAALQNARGSFADSSLGFQPAGRNTSARASARHTWLGGLKRSSSYRAKSARPASVARTESSVGTIGTTLTAFKRFSSGGGLLGLAVNNLKGHNNSGSGSISAPSDDTKGSGGASPLTAGMVANQDGSLGLRDTKIRLYVRENSSKWRDMGSARLTILQVDQPGNAGMPPHAVDGQPRLKRVLIHGKTEAEVMLDEQLGETCFERVARTGIAVSVWEDSLGPNGEVGGVNAIGGVAGGRAKVYMIQMKSEIEAAYTFSLVGRLRY